MRPVLALVSIAALVVGVSAAELKIKVIDPQAAAVAGAQVSLLEQEHAAPITVQTTSGEGIVSLQSVKAGHYRVQVLAAGFAAYDEDVSLPQTSALTVKLRVATTTETVVVSATRSPVPEEQSATSVATLEGRQLETMQPVSAADAVRFLPGAVVDTAGQRGGLASLFVRGGDSRYNKVIIDDVPVNDPGGTFDFGVVPLAEVDRLEFVRGAQSTLYGSDAMTSVLQVFAREGGTRVPELRLGADGGTFETAHGYLTLSGTRGRFDYNLFGDQFNTNGQGPNDEYSNSLQGANLGLALTKNALLRFHTRHSNSRTGVQSEWNFNGQPLMPPDLDQKARQNNFLASAEVTITGPSRWQHRFSGSEYNHKRTNQDGVMEPGRVSPVFGNIDFPFDSVANINRAGFEYQGDYVERNWARTTMGYDFEDENGFVGDLNSPPLTHGLRRNHALYGQQTVTKGRMSLVAGARFVHNQTFGNKAVPRVAVGLQVLRGSQIFSGTRLHFSYATGIKEPRLEESFASGPFVTPNPHLQAEENRAFEAGVQQS